MDSNQRKFDKWLAAVRENFRTPVFGGQVPEMARRPELPEDSVVSDSVSNPLSRRILAALRPVKGAYREGSATLKETAEYRTKIRQALRDSDLAARLAGGFELLPDISEALPEPWAWWARQNRPRSIESWATHLRRHLNWYLKPSLPLRPSLNFSYLAAAIVFPPWIYTVFDEPLGVSALSLVVAALSLLLLHLSRKGEQPGAAETKPSYLRKPVIRAALVGVGGTILGCFSVLAGTESVWNALSFGGWICTCSALWALSFNPMQTDEGWSRPLWSDAGQVNAEELYLYLYTQYSDEPSKLAESEPAQQEYVLSEISSNDLSVQKDPVSDQITHSQHRTE